MKLLIFTDLHANSKRMNHLEGLIKSKKPDILVCAGDLSWFGEHLNLIAKKINSFKIKTLLIPGNHETEEEIKELSKKYKNIINIHKSIYEKNGFSFFGYGSGGFSQHDKSLEKKFNTIKKHIDPKTKLIIVSHAPPYKTKTDYIHKDHVGSITLRKLIEFTKPVLVVCGHLHETEHIEDKIGNSRIINPGDGEIITLN